VIVRGVTRAPADAVWALLADPWAYSRWVYGTVRIRRADRSWPAPGSRLLHSFGPWPVRVRDDTRVLAAEPPRRLVLLARARPLGSAQVEITLAARGPGTEVTMRQDLRGGLGAWFALAGHAVQLRRNRHSLATLIDLCDRSGRLDEAE
jgi:uncharacterized protein YndB with AHSA1/START domain